ncbi:hypothetical protein AB0K74_48770 [Streptomyces sp. NPDC056159]|uniref:hypothetical protein n=1 Tax=unclassified Streptomyces TaxID=2593676 RepID=UPI003415E13A
MPGPRCTVISGTPLAALGFPLSRDDHTAYLSSTTDYMYDPVDRLAKAVKTGNGTGTETYVHDDNANVVNQTVQGITTAFNYDRDRLLTATTSGATANYNYDPFGRQESVTTHWRSDRPAEHGRRFRPRHQVREGGQHRGAEGDHVHLRLLPAPVMAGQRCRPGRPGRQRPCQMPRRHTAPAGQL